MEAASSARWLLRNIASTVYKPVWLRGSERGVRFVMVLVVHPTIRNPSTQMEQNHLINDGQNPATSDDGL
ncbi:MAG: hypothetical protein QGF29_04810 [Verrucomicrobiota bacterium]|nr:hypothetical protein [Verrucomicrobiota bacterium]